MRRMAFPQKVLSREPCGERDRRVFRGQFHAKLSEAVAGEFEELLGWSAPKGVPDASSVICRDMWLSAGQ